jgi:hypothetical protein
MNMHVAYRNIVAGHWIDGALKLTISHCSSSKVSHFGHVIKAVNRQSLSRQRACAKPQSTNFSSSRLPSDRGLLPRIQYQTLKSSLLLFAPGPPPQAPTLSNSPAAGSSAGQRQRQSPVRPHGRSHKDFHPSISLLPACYSALLACSFVKGGRTQPEQSTESWAPRGGRSASRRDLGTQMAPSAPTVLLK